MSLQPLAIDVEDIVLTAPLEALATEATRRVEAFVAARGSDPIAGFVPCDFHLAARGLMAVKQRMLAPGPSFLEWGSGMGAVACLASALGFEASGIEVVPELVEASRDLAKDHDLAVEFVCGSFIPEGGDDLVDVQGELTWLEQGIEPAYEELGLDPDDFDIVFAYPWPGEEDAVLDLFEHYTPRGALLLTFNGINGLRAYRNS